MLHPAIVTQWPAQALNSEIAIALGTDVEVDQSGRHVVLV